jgi:hypothetical protein
VDHHYRHFRPARSRLSEAPQAAFIPQGPPELGRSA